MTEYPAEGEIAHTEAYLVIEEDLRDLLLGYEDMHCPSCEDSKMTFQDDGGGIEAFCEELTNPPCRMIFTMFEDKKPKQGSLEEWMELYQRDSEPNVAVKVRRIVAWWQQADKPWKGHDAKKDASEIALDAIQNLDELWKD